jgi:hypothetical protein
MVEVVRAKAGAAGATNFRLAVSSAETLSARPGYFELAVIGNAFHRLDRDLAAGRVFSWLQPGGHLALCWSPMPWAGEQSWQRALAAALDRWKAALGAGPRIPAGWEEARSRRPDAEVLSDAGFELAGSHEFDIEHRWSLPELAGLIRSTSFLPAAVLGDQAAAFDAGQSRRPQRGRRLHRDRELRLRAGQKAWLTPPCFVTRPAGPGSALTCTAKVPPPAAVIRSRRSDPRRTGAPLRVTTVSVPVS